MTNPYHEWTNYPLIGGVNSVNPTPYHPGFPSPQATPQQQPSLTVTQQPPQYLRFRFGSEIPHESRGHGAPQNCLTKVQINNCTISNTGPYIHGVVEAFLCFPDGTEHVYELFGRSVVNGRCSVIVHDTGIANFTNIGILRMKLREQVPNILLERKKRQWLANPSNAPYKGILPAQEEKRLQNEADYEAAGMREQLNVAKLGFKGFLTRLQGGVVVETDIVYSNLIYNAQQTLCNELKIAELSRTWGSCTGNDRIWMRTAQKVNAQSTRIQFRDRNGAGLWWVGEGQAAEVYGQVLIIFQTPPYRDLNIEFDVTVEMSLYRTNDDARSEPILFTYKPLPQNEFGRKRMRLDPAFQRPQPYQSAMDYNTQGATSGHGSSWPSNSMAGGQTYSGAGGQTYSGAGGQTYSGVGGQTYSGAAYDSGVYSIPPSDSSFTLSLSQHPVNSWTTDRQDQSKVMCHQVQQRDSGCGSSGEMSLIMEHDGTSSLVTVPEDVHGGETPLHIAVEQNNVASLSQFLKTIENLPNRGDVIDVQNDQKQTALHLAVRYGYVECITSLLAANAKRSLKDLSGNTVAHLLADTDDEKVYDAVLCSQRANPYALDEAIRSEGAYLSILNDNGQSALHLAVMKQRSKLVHSLLQAHAPVDQQDGNAGEYPIHSAVRGKNIDIIDQLIRARCNVNAARWDGTTALHLAAAQTDEALIVKLVQAGADPNCERYTNSPLSSDTDSDEDKPITGKQSVYALCVHNERLLRLLRGEKLVSTE